MEYLFGLLGVIVGAMLMTTFDSPFHKTKDKAAREALKALAKRIGFDIRVYDYLPSDVWTIEPGSHPVSAKEINELLNQQKSLIGAQGKKISMLYEHLGLKIENQTEHIVKTK